MYKYTFDVEELGFVGRDSSHDVIVFNRARIRWERVVDGRYDHHPHRHSLCHARCVSTYIVPS